MSDYKIKTRKEADEFLKGKTLYFDYSMDNILFYRTAIPDVSGDGVLNYEVGYYNNGHEYFSYETAENLKKFQMCLIDTLKDRHTIENGRLYFSRFNEEIKG